jgi:hypothetical protein
VWVGVDMHRFQQDPAVNPARRHQSPQAARRALPAPARRRGRRA